jgi:hypothetical protein
MDPADTSSYIILDTDFWQVYRYKAHVSIRHLLIKYPLTFVMTTAMLPVVHISIYFLVFLKYLN